MNRRRTGTDYQSPPLLRNYCEPMNREPLSNVPSCFRLKIKAGLLQIDPNGPDKKNTKTCLNEAYDVFAGVLSQGGEQLSESLLKEHIPTWVFQWAVDRKWLPWPPQRPRREQKVSVSGRYTSAYEPIPEDELTVNFGVYRITDKYKADIMNLLEPAIARWEAEAAESAGTAVARRRLAEDLAEYPAVSYGTHLRSQTQKGPLVNLTDQQWDLLRVLVSNHESNGGKEFYFTLSFAGGGISYGGGSFVPGTYDDTDLRQLGRERLVNLISFSRTNFRGKPTQLGIESVRRRFGAVEQNRPTPPAGLHGQAGNHALGAMSDLPELPERIQRLHALQWKELIEKHGFTGDHSTWHQSAARRCRAAEIMFPTPPIHPVTSHLPILSTEGRIDRSQLENDPLVVDSIGIDESITLASERLSTLATDYLSLWGSSTKADSENFARWLVQAKAAVVSALKGLWAKSEWHSAWFARACQPKVALALDNIVDSESRRARRFERLLLENPHLSLAAIVAADGEVRSASVFNSVEETLRLGREALENARGVTDTGISRAACETTNAPNSETLPITAICAGFVPSTNRPGPSDMSGLPSWKDLHVEFQKYAEQYDDLSAEYDPLGPGQWTLRGGSRRAQRSFMEIAAKAATRRALPSAKGNAEPWQLWLGYMHGLGWRGPDTPKSSPHVIPTRPAGLSWTQQRRRAEQGERTLSRVFQTSADCCRELAEREESSAAEIDPPTALGGAASTGHGTDGVSNEVTPPVQTAIQSKESASEDRRVAVDAYIAEVLQKTGKRITRTDIWKKAGDKSRTEFERWESRWYERHNRKPNQAANRRFAKILTEKPHLK